MELEEKLKGGSMAEVHLVNGTVRRSQGAWSVTVHRLLKHLEAKRFKHAPKYFGTDEKGREILEFIPGEVENYPLPEYVLSDDSISAAAKILREYHEAVSEFPVLDSDFWQIPELAKVPNEVICHNDFSPYNAVFQNGVPVAMIDFDVAAPGPRIWDVAYSVYRFTSLCEISKQPKFEGESCNRQISLFCRIYGLEDTGSLPSVIIERLETMCLTMERLAKEGHAGVLQNIQDGHLDFYQSEISAIRKFFAVAKSQG